MSVRDKLCGNPRNDGCGKPIGNKAYTVRYDPDLKESIIYHMECEKNLPPLELWTTVPDQVVARRIAEELTERAWEELVEQAWTKHGAAIKAKHKKLLNKYKVKDKDIKEQAKRGLRR